MSFNICKITNLSLSWNLVIEWSLIRSLSSRADTFPCYCKGICDGFKDKETSFLSLISNFGKSNFLSGIRGSLPKVGRMGSLEVGRIKLKNEIRD